MGGSIPCLFFRDGPNSCNMVISSCIHFPTDSILPDGRKKEKSTVYTNHIFSVQPSLADIWIGSML